MSRPSIVFQRTYVTPTTADLRKKYIRDPLVVDDTGADVSLLLPKIGTAYAPVGKRVTVVKPSNAAHAVEITPAALDAVSSGTPGAFPDFAGTNSSALSAGRPGSVTIEATDMNLVGSTQPNPNGGTPTTEGAWLAIGSGAGGSSLAPITPHERALFVDGTTSVPTAQQNGSYATPFATIQQALNAITQEGTTVYIECGRQTNVAAASFGQPIAAIPGGTLFVESVKGFPKTGSVLVSNSIGSTQQPAQLLVYTDIQQSPPAFLGIANGVGAGTIDSFLPVTGTYEENLTLPDFDRMTLLGSGPGVIVVNPPAGGDTLRWVRSASPTAPQINEFRCEQMTFYNISANVADACIRLDANNEPPTVGGTSSAGFFLMQEGAFNYVQTVRLPVTGTTNVFLRRCNRVIFRACPLVRGIVSVNNCSQVIFDVKSGMNRLDLAYDSTQPLTIQGRSTGYVLANGSNVSDQVNLSGHPRFTGFVDTVIGGLVGTGLIVGNSTPSITFQGELSAGTFSPGIVLPLPTNAAAFSTVNFSGARFNRFGVAPGFINVTSLGPNVQPVLAQGTKFQLTTTQFGAIPSPNAVVLDANCSWDVRGGFYPGMALFPAAGPGTLDRDSWAIYAKPASAVGAVQAIQPAFPVGVAGPTGYVVMATIDDLGAGSVAVSLKTNGSFSHKASAAVGNVDFFISRAA